MPHARLPGHVVMLVETASEVQALAVLHAPEELLIMEDMSLLERVYFCAHLMQQNCWTPPAVRPCAMCLQSSG